METRGNLRKSPPAALKLTATAAELHTSRSKVCFTVHQEPSGAWEPTIHGTGTQQGRFCLTHEN